MDQRVLKIIMAKNRTLPKASIVVCLLSVRGDCDGVDAERVCSAANMGKDEIVNAIQKRVSAVALPQKTKLMEQQM